MQAIYKIRNTVNNKCYIGSSVNIKARKQEHFRDLVLNKHHCIALQRAYNLYGKDKFSFEIIEVVNDKSYLISREQFHIDRVNPEYNCLRFAGSNFGFKHSEESNKLNSLRNRGEKNNKAKIKEADIPKILDLRNSKTTREIATSFNVSIDSISRIINGKSFKHLNLEKKEYKKQYPEEARKILSEKAKNRKSTVAKKTKILNERNEIIGVFESLTSAAKAIDIPVGTLFDLVKGKTKNSKIKAFYMNDATR